MRIVINPLDKKSIDKAYKQIIAYKKDFKKKEQEFVKRLAEIGVSVASAGFELADYDGINDVNVRLMKKAGGGYSVMASGETVGFIEFGTGINNPEWVDDGNVSGAAYTPPPHGSYGKGHGKQPHGWWFYPNPGASATHTKGNVPAEAMLTARNEMIDKVTQIAREVWR